VDARSLQEKLSQKGAKLALIEDNLIDKIWTDRPSRPSQPVFALPLRYTGQSMEDKLKQLREKLNELNACGILLSALDEIACK
jgi:Xaa-Pro aminopeptidase